jgi:hypothetical protein
MTQVKVERSLVLIESSFAGGMREATTGRGVFYETRLAPFCREIFPPSKVTIDALRSSELNILSKDHECRMVLTCELPDTTGSDLLQKAATKAKSGDTKEAIALAVEALQLIATERK